MGKNRFGKGISFIKKAGAAALVFGLGIAPSFSLTSFSIYDINQENNLLYSVDRDVPGSADISALFECRLGKNSAEGNPSMLTCAPEKIELLSDNLIQVRNIFGTARYSMASGKLAWVLRGNVYPVAWSECKRQCESPDGKWICQEDLNGNLFLLQVSTGIQVQISNEPSLSDRLLVKWSDDSRFFLYEEKGVVYFASTDASIKKLLPPSSMRKIGEGSLDCVQWVGGTLFYACGDVLYKIEGRELYTRGLYYPVVGSGKPVARLTSDFDPFHDNFWMSNDGKYLLYINGKKIVSLYSIPSDFGFLSVREMENMTGLNGSILDVKVFWSAKSEPVLWIENLSYSKGKKSASVYSFDKGLRLLESYDDPGVIGLSPDGKKVAFSHGNMLEVRQIEGWKKVCGTADEKILSFKWKDSASIVAGGNKTLFEWGVSKNDSKWVKKVLYLSSVKTAVWESDKIYAWTDIDNTCYEYVRGKNSWKSAGKRNPPVSKGSAMNGKFRVYTGESKNDLFGNAVIVRSLTSSTFTYHLVPETAEEKKSKGKVSIIFDATDGNEGLSQVLSVLEKFNLRSTFFINGEFIRRYPMEVCQIVASGNHCASGFFTTADLLSEDFKIDADFIRRGLARNEDEFFAATGKELELLWHAPLYKSNEMMVRAGESAGYTYVDAWDGFNDRVSYEQALSVKGKKYMTADEIIDATTSNLYDGMVICVDVGNIKGSRSDYVYEKVQNLVANILGAGYEIVAPGAL